MTNSIDDVGLDGVAVIGLAGRFPGAASVEELWENLKAGRESIRTFTDEELAEAEVPAHLIADPSYVRARGLLDAPEAFDAAFFGISPHEAELMDPQHRLFLETCWHALENAGYAPASINGSVGVWGGQSTGMSNDTYLHSNLGGPGGVAEEDVLSALLGNENDYLTTRVSYKLNLRGPSVNVQTACSTSLVGIVQAFQSLLTFGCDLAVAGGVSVSYPQVAGYLYQEGAIPSPDGHCRPFDADAQGTVFSNGVGAVVLKRLDEALADGDTILAVIRGAAMNNDGASKVSFAAPSVEGQAEVIATAQAVAGVDPGTVTFVETHGTGTPIGDPIEVEGLTRAFRRGTMETGFCALGSIKSNFGHLDSAAGVVGFIKAVLSLHHQTLVPTIHFKQPSPKIDWEASPFFVNAETRFWDTDRLPRRAGVSSFGIGGTNAHVVLEEAPRRRQPADPPAGNVEILPLSARCPDALRQATGNLVEHLKGANGYRLCDVAHTLQVGREAFRHRAALVASDGAEVAEIMEQGDRTRIFSAEADGQAGQYVFLFPGGGAQYVGMGRGLYEAFPSFRRQVDRGLELLATREGMDLRPIWFPEPGNEEEAAEAFQKPSVQLPAIFILEMALAQLLRDRGFEPAALMGHSMGENTAAALAEVLSYEDALGLVALRGRLFDSAAPGGMLSVTCAPEELTPLLGSNLDLAAVNGPEQCTVSGPKEALADLHRELEKKGVEAQVVPIDIAAHSWLVDPLLEPFEAYLRSIDLNPPKIPFLSNQTGTWITDAEAVDPSYWASHLRSTVLFADNVRRVLENGTNFFLEVGPGRILSSLVKLADPGVAPRVSAIMRHPKEEMEDTRALMNAVARMWVSGGEVSWDRLRGTMEVRRIPLPGYPFQRRPFLIEPESGSTGHTRVGKTASTHATSPGASLPEVGAAATPSDPDAILRQVVDLQARTNAAIQAYLQAVGGSHAAAIPSQLEEGAGSVEQGAVPSAEASEETLPAPAAPRVDDEGSADLPDPEPEERLAFWTEHLRPPLPVLDFMTDFPRPRDGQALRSTASAPMENSVVEGADRLAREEETTRSQVLLAAYLAVLHHETGQSELVVGVPVTELAGDATAVASDQSGQTLTLRSVIEPRASFRHLVRHVRDICREGWRFRNVDWNALLGVLGALDDPARDDLFQTRFRSGKGGGWIEIPDSARQGASPTIFDLRVESKEAECQVHVDYDGGLFAPGTMEEMASHFAELLRIGVQDPGTPVRSLPMAAPGVMERLGNWNETSLSLPRVDCIADWLTEKWSAKAEHMAVVAEDQQLTYAQLDEESNRLAHHLVSAGVAPGSLVGLCLERTSELLVAVVAVWKAGAGYVPLDPTYPSARLEYMTERAGLDLVVTTEGLGDRIGGYPGRRILMDRDRGAIEAHPGTRPRVEADPSYPAYVIFTSGSTGEPKGVRVPARGVVNFLESMARRPGFDGTDVLLAVTTLSFDISVLELFLPLRAGGTVVLASAADAMDGAALARLMDQHEVTVLQGTPSTWRLLCSANWGGHPALRALCGGEAFPRDLLQDLLPRVGQVWNMYGPTETTVWSTCVHLTDAEGPIVIGPPIHNTRCYVLDEDSRLVAPGVPGELYIGGGGVTDGYLGRPEETARRFVPDPVTPGGGRIYRTGDMARWRRNGSLEHLHRVDQQVKLRGFRIELGEIEATLAATSGVREAAVILSEVDGTPELVGYVAADEGSLNERALRERVAERLPAYMVPRILMRLDQMPLTDNGKVDRKALPDPGTDPGWGESRSTGLVAPDTEAERYLVGVWKEVLDIPDLSVDDNFFDLGGHSLLAVRTIARIREERGVEVPLRALITGTLGMIAERYIASGEGLESEVPGGDPDGNGRDGGVLGTVRGWISR